MDKRASACTHFPHQSPHRFPAYFCHRHSQSRIPTLIPNPPCMKNLKTCMKHCMATGMNSAWIFLQVPFSRTVLPSLGTAIFFHAMQNGSANRTCKMGPQTVPSNDFFMHIFFQQIVSSDKLGAALCRVSMPCTRLAPFSTKGPSLLQWEQQTGPK